MQLVMCQLLPLPNDPNSHRIHLITAWAQKSEGATKTYMFLRPGGQAVGDGLMGVALVVQHNDDKQLP